MARRRASLVGSTDKIDRENARTRDTVPPPTRSHARLRSFTQKTSVEALRAAADRYRKGDFHGALLEAMRVLDEQPVPIMCASPTYLARVKLRGTERLLLTLVDGRTSLEELLDESDLGLLDGVDAVCGLLDAGIIALSLEDVEEPGTLPGV